jgi:hypothetical protein
MLLKHPSKYKHQIAFTFPGARRNLYCRVRNALLQDDRFKNWMSTLGIPPSDHNILWEKTWSEQTAPEFYEAYRDAVLIVVFFDENHQKSKGAYPEWQIIEREAAQMHRRISLVKFDSHTEWKTEGPHFNGIIDLRSYNGDDDKCAGAMLSQIVDIWEKIVSPWVYPPINTVLCFGGHHPSHFDVSMKCIDLPKLDRDHFDAITGTIASENASPFLPCPLRSTCVYGPPECLEYWAIFERVIGHISQEPKFHRRTSVRIPVFVTDGARAATQSLENLIFRKNSGDLEVRNAWESNYRPSSTFESWLADINARPLINIITSSKISKEQVQALLERSKLVKDKNSILNLWRWDEGCMYPSRRPFDVDMASLFYASKEANSENPLGSNLLHESTALDDDRKLWRSKLGGDGDSLQTRLLDALLDKPYSFKRWDSQTVKR